MAGAPFKPRYIIDSSSLIELRERYPRELAPGAWQLIESLVDSRALASSEEVLEELSGKDDDLFKWARERSEIFIPLYSDIQLRAKHILADHPDLIDTKRRKSSADPFVIATAELVGSIVVTEEDLVGPGNRVRIPNVCRIRSVPCIRLKQMLIAEGLVLVAQPQR